MSSSPPSLPASCPVDHGKKAPVSASLPASCPVDHKGAPPRSRGTVYNVYAQPLPPVDPTNQMPAAPAQVPSPGQRMPLSTERVVSTITKGGTESTWLYPSPQMFWNALVRKGKAEDVQEGEVDMVVSIHNEMNERAWKQLLERRRPPPHQRSP